MDKMTVFGKLVLGVGCWVLGAGCWVLGTGYWVLGTGYLVLGSWQGEGRLLQWVYWVL